MYIKIPAAAGAPAKILFYYNRDRLFDDVSLMSNYMAKNLATKDGEPLTDNFALSDDERALVSLCTGAALPDIYDAMTKTTTAVTPAFESDASEGGPEAAEGERKTTGTDRNGETVTIPSGRYVEIALRDNAAYNENSVIVVDESLYNALKYGVLKEVYSNIVSPDFLRLCGERFAAELVKLKQRLFQLKRRSAVRLP